MTEKQKKVIAIAKQQLRNFGITTICLDRLPNHDNFDDNEIVKELVNDTIYWEQRKAKAIHRLTQWQT
jgi:hypothetical protein